MPEATETEESVRVFAKHVFKSENTFLKDYLLQWFQQHRAEGIPISGPVLCEKVNELAARFSVEDFHASTRWLHKFKVRHGIGSKSVCGG